MIGAVNWLDFVIPLVGLLVILAAVSPFLRAQSTKSTVELLRSELEVEREARIEQERRCNREIAELRGQLKVITKDFALTLAKEVAAALRREGL